MSNNDETRPIPGAINANTYISGGLVVVVLGGFMAVINVLYSTKGEITARLDKVEWRMGTYEKASTPHAETWTDRDMFKWTVRLQRDNPNMKVPEPAMETKETPPP